MKKRYILLLLTFFLTRSLPSFSQCGTITLTSQAEVNAFSCTEINSLIIEGAGSDIIDLSPLSDLSSINDLTISNTDITDLSGLENIISTSGQLTITIHNNDDLTSLAGLGSVGIEVSRLVIENNDQLSGLTGLPEYNLIGNLDVVNNSLLTTLDGLSGNTQVNVLWLEGDITDLGDALTGQTRLEDLLILNNSALTSLEGFLPANVLELPELSLINCTSLTSLSGLPPITSFSGLELSGNTALTDLTGLPSSLQIIDEFRVTSDNGFTSLSTIPAGVEAINEFIILNSGIISLEGLSASQTRIEKIFLSTVSGFSSFDGFLPPQILQVDQLTVSGCPDFASLSGLEGITNFDILDIQRNPLLTSLDGLPVSLATIGKLVVDGNGGIQNFTGMAGLDVEVTSLTIRNGIASLEGFPVPDFFDRFEVISNDDFATLGDLIPAGLPAPRYFSLIQTGLTDLSGFPSDWKELNTFIIRFNPELVSLNGSESLNFVANVNITFNSKLTECCIVKKWLDNSIATISNNGAGCTFNEIITDPDCTVPCTVPEAEFTVQNGCEGDQITFTDASNFVESNALYAWDFGDGSVSETVGNVNHTYQQSGTYTVTLTITQDDCSDTYSATVDIFDVPEVTLAAFDPVCPGSDPVELSGGNPAGGTYSGMYISQDSETGVFLFDPVAAGEGIHPVFYSVTNENGCLGLASTTITVGDEEAPELVVKDAEVELDENGTFTISVDELVESLTDNCQVEGVFFDIEGQFSESYTFDCDDVSADPAEVLIVALDAAGNSTDKIGQVLVKDVTAPVLAYPKDLVVALDENGTATLNLEDVDEGSTDACGIASLVLSENTFDCGSLGLENSVKMTGVDVNGNTTVVTITVTVIDDLAPIAKVKPVSITLDDAGSAELSFEDIDDGSSDNCGITSVELSQESFTCDDIGENEVSVIITDGAGNESQSDVIVTITDDIDPVASLKDIELSLDEQGYAMLDPASLDNGSTDNCGELSFTADITEFNCEHLGENEVSVIISDPSGNESVATAVITIVDDLAPSVMTKNITVTLDADGSAEISPEMLDDGSYDNCGIESLALDITSLNCDNVGENEVMLTAVDPSGNEGSAIALVTVEYTAPEIGEIEVSEHTLKTGDQLEVAIPYSGSLAEAVINWGDGFESEGMIGEEQIIGSHYYDTPGLYEITATIFDACAGEAIVRTYSYVVVHESVPAFVTGGGWFNSSPGSYVPDPNAEGKTHFAFVFYYSNRTDKLCGKLNFRFRDADLWFMSAELDWMIVTENNAWVSGTGVTKSQKKYGFLLAVSDNKEYGYKRDDRIRVKIWEKESGDIVYDNQGGEFDGNLPTQKLDRGAIVIHIKKHSGFVTHEEADIADYVDNDLSLTRAYPNPVQDQLTLSIPAAFEDDVRMIMIDQKGQMVIDKSLHLRSGINDLTLDLYSKDLDPGIYVVKLMGNNTAHTLKIIKQ